jgi:hypothetical protein
MEKVHAQSLQQTHQLIHDRDDPVLLLARGEEEWAYA